MTDLKNWLESETLIFCKLYDPMLTEFIDADNNIYFEEEYYGLHAGYVNQYGDWRECYIIIDDCILLTKNKRYIGDFTTVQQVQDVLQK